VNVETEKPVIRCLIAYVTPWGHVILSKQITVPLEEVEEYKRLGFWAFYDFTDQKAVEDWYRDQLWCDRRRWLT
jgi:hypothetical protein